ncbi:transporter [Runella sp.]|uniref:transporter n=1 Tax=Runella sp. TaxID=1960881 RepID=UPI003D105060
MKRIFYTLFSLLCVIESYSQGCVAVRHMSCAATNSLSSAEYFKQKNGQWQVSMGYRYFRSHRHFVGDVEQTQRAEAQTEVVNLSHALDLGISYQPNARLSFGINLPIQYNDRSSLYEHYGNPAAGSGVDPAANRFHTYSQGIGDMRLSVTYWMRNPYKLPKFNFALGLGVKLPTGKYDATDNFHKLDKEKHDYLINKPVDQSIQLGDGGVGYSLETQGYWQIAKKTTLYFNGFYLFNPKETNGVVRSPEATTIDLVTGTFSVADQFAGRFGFSQSIGKGLSLMLGGRLEGVPAIDVFGGSKGFRRPGYIVSVEPGIAYMKGKFSAAATVPYALYRNRTRSYADRLDPLGVKHGDAAFADYLVSVNISRWF